MTPKCMIDSSCSRSRRRIGAEEAIDHPVAPGAVAPPRAACHGARSVIRERGLPGAEWLEIAYPAPWAQVLAGRR